MSGELLSHGGGDARCALCGALAVGPCARCRAPICGDCCVLTTGGLTTFAICFRCERRGGASLGPGWAQVIGWFMFPIAALLAALIALQWLMG
jgi:hypothetical protein